MRARVSTDWSFHGTQALVLENGRLRAVVLPALGGRIWQLTQLTQLPHGRDLLWHNPRITARPVPFGAVYDDVFFGGWDELFPNDAPEELAGEAYPDHGELWTSPWSWRIVAEGPDAVQVRLSLDTPISACRFTKTLTLVAGEPRLGIGWRIENAGSRDLPYLWKQHLAVPVDEPARLTMGARSMYVEDFGSPRSGRTGTWYRWPYLVEETAAGRRHDMRTTLPGASRVSEFQYATDLDGGWCAVTYADGCGIGMAFDTAVFRSCWTFASYGGWRAHQVLVLEPCTGHPISVNEGVAAGTHRILPVGEVIDTELTVVAYEGMADVSGITPDGGVEGDRSDCGRAS